MLRFYDGASFNIGANMTSRDLVPAVIGSVVSDVLSILLLPGNTAALAIQKLIEARLNAAREILLDEIALGVRPASDVVNEDEIAAIAYRFYRAAQEGAARLNLRLLAQCAAGKIAAAVLRADEFLHYADILASLKREEVVLLGSAIRHQKDFEREKAEQAEGSTGEAESNVASIHKRVSDELVSSTMFPTRDHLLTCMGSLQRTGLILLASGYGALVMVPSPRLAEIESLIDVEAALKKEP